MPRLLSLAILAVAASCALLLIAASATGCNDVETTGAPDSAPPPCNPGPFAFPGPLGGDQATTPGCSSDDNPQNLEVILKLPRGARYAVKTTVNFVGDRNPQGDCDPRIICKCDVPTTTTPPAPIGDAGPDADAEAPAPTPTPGAPAWFCF